MTARSQRFSKQPDKAAERYTASVRFDCRLARCDVAGSIAHARMLARQGIIPQADAEAIVRGMEEIRAEIEQGKFLWRDELEDVHMNIEARLHEKIGEAAGRLHTARSRNDQVALDLRMYARDACQNADARLRDLQRALLAFAEGHTETVMPGYTHLQRAQPVLFAHHLLAYVHMLQRDRRRFARVREAADAMPLGSGALAGVPYPIDRESVAKELGFSRVSDNSLDAVSDRDFLLDYHAAAATCMMHLSRLAEEIVLWSSAEFGFVEVDDAYATGSSIMPQKKNPDVAELARGKTGRVYGHLLGLLTTLKGLPLAYNRDLQVDKEGFFDTVDTLEQTLEVFAGMVSTLHVDEAVMRRAATGGFALATDIADYLVRAGLPFRQAHAVVAGLVRHAIEQGKTLEQLSLDEYKRFSPLFQEDVKEVTLERSLAARDVPGGTAPARVRAALRSARRMVDAG